MRRSLLELELPPPFFWPPGYPLLVAVASLALGPVPLAGQLVSLTAGALTPVFTALLAREVWPEDRAAPVVAGLLAAFTGQLWQSSVVVMADVLGLAAASAGVWALARYGRRGDLRWLLVAAGLLAGATMTRWIYGIVAVPCAVYALLVACRHRGRVALTHAAAASGVAAVILAPVLVAALDPSREAQFAGNFEVYEWNPLRIFDREFATADGTLSYSLPTGVYYAVAPARWTFFTPLLAPLILLGVVAAIRRRAAAPVLLLLGWAAAVYVFHAGAAYQNFRFTLAFLPPLAILAGIGAGQVARLLFARRLGVALAAGVFALGLAVMAAAGANTTHSLIERKNDGLALVRWTEATAPPRARLITFNLTHTFRRYSRLEIFELYEQDPRRLAALMASQRPVFLLVDLPSLRGQWSARSPGRNLRWLERRAGLTAIDTQRGFTLFRVGASTSRRVSARTAKSTIGGCSPACS